jgi:hypothetical protein
MSGYHSLREDGHECPECGMVSICTIEDGFCENAGVCDNCIRQQVMNRDSYWDYEEDIPEDTPSLDGFGPHY